MINHKTIAKTILTIATSLPLIASANSLWITNNTSHDSTSVINGKCTSSLPGGIRRHNSTNQIRETLMKIACYPRLEDCVAQVYMTNNCTGPIITTAHFSITKGILSVAEPQGGYKITWAPFKITIDGPFN